MQVEIEIGQCVQAPGTPTPMWVERGHQGIFLQSPQVQYCPASTLVLTQGN